MASRLFERLKKIEALFRPKQPAWPFCVEVGASESHEQAWRKHIDRYGKPRGRPHVIFAPAMLTQEAWLETFGWSDDLD